MKLLLAIRAFLSAFVEPYREQRALHAVTIPAPPPVPSVALGLDDEETIRMAPSLPRGARRVFWINGRPISVTPPALHGWQEGGSA